MTLEYRRCVCIQLIPLIRGILRNRTLRIHNIRACF